MFGKRNSTTVLPDKPAAAPARRPHPSPRPSPCRPPRPPPKSAPPPEDTRFNEIKVGVFNALLDAVDLKELSKLAPEAVREELTDIICEIVNIKRFVLSAAEQQHLVDDICNDILGLGPLEPLIARDDIADIMVNGYNKVYIETDGKIVLTDIKFRDNAQLMNICQRIVSAVGRRVDEASPICDARLMDGSRVNVIAPPLAIDGAALTIRKFKKEKLTLEKLVEFGSCPPAMAEVLKIIGNMPAQRADLGRHRLGQDDAAQLPHLLYRRGRAHHHLRGRGRAATAAAARGAARDPPAQSRRRRPDHHARSRHATACACGPNGSSSARCAAPRPSTCCRR